MRPLVPLALLAIFLAPSLSSADSWEDETGDVEVSYDASGDTDPLWIPANGYGHLDLVEVGIEQDEPTSVLFVVRRASVEPGQDALLAPVLEYHVGFRLEEKPYRMTFAWDQVANTTQAILESFQGDRWVPENVTASVAVDGDAWRHRVPLDHLRTLDLAPARPGDILTDVTGSVERSVRFHRAAAHVDASCPSTSGFEDPDECGYTVRDSVADGAVLGDVELLPDGGPGQSFTLEAPDAVRASNGLNTTVLYTLHLSNHVGQPLEVALEARDLPEGWTVFAPPLVTVPGGATSLVPVAASIPFQHRHGAEESVVITARALDDATTNEVQLSVIYPEVPQPSGHHQVLHLHGDDTSRWMNALAVDGTHDPIRGYDAGTGTQGGNNIQAYSWLFPLSPQLIMGLDGDLDRAGQLRLSFGSAFDMDGEVEGYLMLQTASGYHDLATVESAPVSLRAGQVVEWQAALNLTQFADRVAPAGDQNLLLRVRLAGVPPAAGTAGYAAGHGSGQNPFLVPGESTLTLPLFEYHERIDEEVLVSLDAGWRIDVDGEHVFQAAPGGLAVVPFEVTSTAGRDGIDWTVFGAEGQRVTLVDAPRSLGAGETALAYAVLEVTPETPVGAVVSFLVVASDDAGGRTVGAALAFITDDPAAYPGAPDPLLLLSGATGGEDAPGVGVVLVLGVLALAAAFAARTR